MRNAATVVDIGRTSDSLNPGTSPLREKPSTISYRPAAQLRSACVIGPLSWSVVTAKCLR
jgi:hypothetical protein